MCLRLCQSRFVLPLLVWSALGLVGAPLVGCREEPASGPQVERVLGDDASGSGQADKKQANETLHPSSVSAEAGSALGGSQPLSSGSVGAAREPEEREYPRTALMQRLSQDSQVAELRQEPGGGSFVAGGNQPGSADPSGAYRRKELPDSLVGSMESKGGAAVSAPPQPVMAPAADKNGWYQSSYQAGTGERESLETAIAGGVLVNGERIKLDTFTGGFSQSFPFPASGSLGMTVQLERSKADPSGGSTFLQVGLQSASVEAGQRPPLAVALVIDRSGSMAKQGKLEAVKAAALEVIQRLEDRDSIALISYNDLARLDNPLRPLSSRRELRAAVEQLEPTGGTNIFAGLDLAYQTLASCASPAATQLVLLLSDGKVSAGERSPSRFEALARKASDRGVETTSIGMGLDYDESLMMAISRSGAGNYHFLKGREDAVSVISREVEELSRSVARGVRLRVELAEGIALVRVLGSEQLSEQQVAAVKAEERQIDQRIYEELGIQRDRADQDEPGIKMLIPSFRANDSHLVMLELRTPPGHNPRSLARVEVKYKDMVTKKNETLVQNQSLQVASSRAASVASIDRGVKKNLLGFRTGETLMTAARHLNRGDLTGAMRAIDEQLVLLGVAAREWQDSDLERDALLLGRYKTVLQNEAQRGQNRELVSYLSKSFSYSAYQRLQ